MRRRRARVALVGGFVVVYDHCVLTQLVIKNFKSFRDETIDFSRSGLTVLVGPNGSGKSTVLEAVSEVVRRWSGSHERLVACLRRGSTELSLLATAEIDSVVPRGRINFALGTQESLSAKLVLDSIEYLLWHGGGSPDVAGIIGPGGISKDAVIRAAPEAKYFDVDLRALRHPLQPPTEGNPSVVDAAEVIQKLLDLKLGSDLHAFERLVADAQRIVPPLKALSLKRSYDGVEKVERYGLQFDMTTGAGIDASQVSEGTLLVVALCTATQADGSTVLLIDDIDRALHPVAQRELIRFLRATVKARPIQVICTSHSPYVLGEFDYSEVRVLREVEGESKCIALDQGPEAERWMKELDAGEYWSFMESKLFTHSHA